MTAPPDVPPPGAASTREPGGPQSAGDTRPSIALVPLDERPACTVLPRQVAAVAGVEVLTPPPDVLPAVRRPGDPAAIGAWLRDARADAAVVSLETLGHGGLIASRTRPATVASVTSRWQPVRDLADRGVPVHAVTLITRTPDSADAMEEPSYWDPHGPALHRLSGALHRAITEPAADRPLSLIPADVPDPVRRDFLTRRLRNHAVNLAALELAADRTVESLVVGADDTAEFALSTLELHRLEQWSEALGMGDRVAVRPGADEACTTLVARTVVAMLGAQAPVVRIEAVDTAQLQQIADYENVPVGATAARQLRACGALPIMPDGAPDGGRPDAVLLVHTPDRAGDWAVAPPTGTDPAPARAVARRAAQLLGAGVAVAVADCAQPNGSDPALVAALAEEGLLEHLTSYAGWNTAGNTLGTVAAHTVTAVAARRAGCFDSGAHRALLLHRLIEDWGWMSRSRAEVRSRLGSDPTRHDHVPDGHPVLRTAADLLARRRAELPAFTEYALDTASVRLPWQRTFEIDFALVRTADAHPQEHHQ